MVKVFDVANFFIYFANKRPDDFITNLKINKLLYYSQGVFLARTDSPLFSNNIEAWDYGPVVPEVYRKYNYYGKSTITKFDPNFTPDIFNSKEIETLLDVMREVGKFTGYELVNLTHQQGTPWNEVYKKGANNIISLEILKKYFKNNPIKELTPTHKIPTVKVLPKELYDPLDDCYYMDYFTK